MTLGLPLADDVLRRKEQVLDAGGEPALEHDRLVQGAHLLEEAEVLHVPGPDLDDVGVAVRGASASRGSMISVTKGRPVSSLASAR